jgi:predicted nucleic acid-binding protein
MIVLDTNAISELMRPRPDAGVLRWIDRQPMRSIWTTPVTLYEIRAGLLSMPAGKKQAKLNRFVDQWLDQVLERRVLDFDTAAGEKAAELEAAGVNTGRMRELRDTMIAGIVQATRATLATRNVKHFEDIAASVVNPWEA